MNREDEKRTNRMNFGESTREKENPSTVSGYNDNEQGNGNGRNRGYSYNDKYKSSTNAPRREQDEKSSTRQGYRGKVTNIEDRRQEREPVERSDGNKEVKQRENRKDNYTTSLSNVIYNIEDVYGLRVQGSTGKAICNLPIDAFMSEFQLIIKQMPLLDKQEKRKAVGAHVAELMFVQSYLRYFRTAKLNFSNLEGISEVGHVLSLALHHDKTVNVTQHLNILIRSLQSCDRMNPKARNTLSYRFIRLFIIAIATADLVHASILAEFILNQINHSEIGGSRNARR